MSNGNVFERLWKLVTTANKLVLDGKRDPEDLCDLLQLFIEQKQQTKVWKEWKTIKLGTGLKPASSFQEAMRLVGVKIDSRACDILGRPSFTTATSETEVKIVLVTVAKLGFKYGATFKDVCVRAKELGLDLCPPEVGPQLRLQYTDQPKAEWLVIAMEPLIASDGYPCLFGMVYGGGVHWLEVHSGNPDNFWRGSTRFVFLQRK